MSIKDVYEYKLGEYQDLSKIEQDIAGTANVPFVYRGISISGYNINLFDDALGTTQLVLDTDYSLLFRDNTISDNESENVFAGYTVINVAYQSVKLYLDIRCIGGYTKFTGGTYEEISTPQTITPPSFGHTVYVDTSGGDIALTINDATLNNDTITIVSKGANDTTLTMAGIAGGIIPGGEARTFLWVGASWYLVSDGVDGISIDWQGSLASAPGSPELNWGYYDTTDKKSYIWDGDSWEILSQDGTNGTNGTDGTDGVTIIWQGSLASAPGSPVAYWAYYNTTDKKSYIYDGSSWDILAQDGANGISIVWKGDLTTAPSSPELNWGYYDTTDKKSYIYDGDSWEILAQDGTNGTNGEGVPTGGVVNDVLIKSSSTNYDTEWNQGSGSGIDADKLDGQEGSYYYSSANPPSFALPIGFIYFQMPGKSSPTTLGFSGTWSNISTSWPGDFLRIEGGNASTFASGQQGDAIRNITGTFTASTGLGISRTDGASSP
ncbi:MAG: hypothetical protein DRJ01_12540, partial [Bacteroidetes bacterium]